MNNLRKLIKKIILEMMEGTETAPAPVKPKIQPGEKPAPSPRKNPLQIPIRKPDNIPMPEPKANTTTNESPEVAPAEPVIKPKIKPQPRRNPLQIPIRKPDNIPMPEPKAQKKNLSEQHLNKCFRVLEEKLKFKRFLNEKAPMDFDPSNNYRPASNFQSGIEGKSQSPFSDIEFLQKKELSQSTLERLGSEEFNRVVSNIQQIGKMEVGAIMTAINSIKTIEASHRGSLENLAIEAVARNFGLPDDIKSKLRPKLVSHLSMSENIMLDDAPILTEDEKRKNPLRKATVSLSPEQQVIAKKLINKRIIQNALSMGSGYQAHRLFTEIRPAINAIDPRLYPLYEKVMGNMEFHLWTIEFSVNSRVVLGKSWTAESDGINEDTNNEGEIIGHAQATIFLILLHEVAKVAVELLFLQSVFNISEEHGEDMYKYVLSKSDSYAEEQWMKLVGPVLWKYLHSAISFIVGERGDDFTIVSYLLNKISLLPPQGFLNLMNKVVNDGGAAIRQLEIMLDEINQDIADYEAQNNNQTPQPEDIMPEPDYDNIENLMSQVNNILTNHKEPEGIQNHKPFNQMSVEELKTFVNIAIEAGEYDLAAEANDEIETRGKM